MGILALAQITLAETIPQAEYADVRSRNKGVVLLDGAAETLTAHLHALEWRVKCLGCGASPALLARESLPPPALDATAASGGANSVAIPGH